MEATLSPTLQGILERQQIARWMDYSWAKWLLAMFPDLFRLADGSIEFAHYHIAWWNWVFSVPTVGRPRPYLNCQPRDTGKSLGMEVAACYLGLEGIRKYFLYVCSTQDQADDHVTTISTLLERPEVARWYPEHANRKVGKYEQSRGWRVNRLWTAGGLIIDAVGLDKAKRGARLEKERPDGLFADDFDGRHESTSVTEKKKQKFTEDLLPALNRERAVVAFGQNLIHENSIMSQLMNGTADFLLDAVRSGPHVAIEDLEYDREAVREMGPDGLEREAIQYTVTGGTPTWQGFSYPRLSEIITTVGERSFLREYQQQLDKSGVLWTPDLISQSRWPENEPIPDLQYVGVAVDPKTADKGSGAETGIVGGGASFIGRELHVWVMHDKSGDYSPEEWAEEVLILRNRLGGGWIAGERNNGGALVERNIKALDPKAEVDPDIWASRGKFARAEEVVLFYEQGRVHHVGVFNELEQQMTTPYDPRDRTLLWDRMDALVWLLWKFLIGQPGVLSHYDPKKHQLPRNN